jgi:hypothetical protein
MYQRLTNDFHKKDVDPQTEQDACLRKCPTEELLTTPCVCGPESLWASKPNPVIDATGFPYGRNIWDETDGQECTANGEIISMATWNAEQTWLMAPEINSCLFEKLDIVYHTVWSWPEKKRASKIINICDPHVGLRKSVVRSHFRLLLFRRPSPSTATHFFSSFRRGWFWY